MNVGPPARHVLVHARDRMHRLSLTRQLEAVALGRARTVAIDVAGSDTDAEVLDLVLAGLRPGSSQVHRLATVLERAGVTAAVLDGLASSNPARVARLARIAGRLRMDEAVGLLGLLLGSDHRKIADAAARALGRIGGARSADALLRAIQREGLRPRLLVELAKAAPDLFLEVALANQRRPTLVIAAALAAGMRGRQTSVGPLVSVLASGTRRQRVVSCRALGWIGGDRAPSVLTAALDDREARVRVAAMRALATLHAGPANVWTEA